MNAKGQDKKKNGKEKIPTKRGSQDLHSPFQKQVAGGKGQHLSYPYIEGNSIASIT